MDIISSILNSHGIELFSAVDFSDKYILYPEKFDRTITKYGLSDIRTVIIYAVPYYTGLKTNVSAYAAAGDYHKLLGELNAGIIGDLSRNFPCSVFAGMADNSPLNELKIAESANIGSRGDNGIMLTRRYSSFVFLSTIVTDMIIDHEILPAENNSNGQQMASAPSQKNSGKRNGTTSDAPASAKQIKFLLDLARQYNVSPDQIKAKFNVPALESLTKTQCSRAIDELSGKAA